MSIERPYLLFLGDVADQLAAKTAHGINEWRPEECVGQMRLPGCQADLGIVETGLDEALAAGARTLVIGVVNSGGVMPDHWEAVIIEAIGKGFDVAAGLHARLNDMPAIKAAAVEHGRTLHDVRQPTQTFRTGTGIKRRGKRLLAVGTDCSCGKKYTALAVERAMSKAGFNAEFRATGQTGILIAGDGVAIDAVVADFISGAVEWLAPDNDADHWDVIEGQGSLFHPSFAGVSLGLLHGAQPDALILCHEPTRTHMRNLKQQPLPTIEVCMEANLRHAKLTNPAAKFVGISVYSGLLGEDERQNYFEKLEKQTGLPVFDSLRCDLTPLLERLV